MTLKMKILIETDAKEKKKLITGAKLVAGDITDDLPYKVKEYFGEWPADIVGPFSNQDVENIKNYETLWNTKVLPPNFKLHIQIDKKIASGNVEY